MGSLYDELLAANRGPRPSLTPIEDALRACWCRETARPEKRNDWSPWNKSLGQDDVTALLVLLELRDGWLRIGRLHGGEYWYNREPNGEGYCDWHYAPAYPIDHQALQAARQLDRREAAALLAADDELRQRYELLAARLREFLKNGTAASGR